MARRDQSEYTRDAEADAGANRANPNAKRPGKGKGAKPDAPGARKLASRRGSAGARKSVNRPGSSGTGKKKGVRGSSGRRRPGSRSGGATGAKKKR